jgi:hypothetical protein
MSTEGEWHLVRGCACWALCTRSHHSWLEQDTLEHDTVVSHVLEGLCPCVLGNLEGLVDGVFAIEQHLHVCQFESDYIHVLLAMTSCRPVDNTPVFFMERINKHMKPG